jgi:hypothetical protein
LPVSFRLARNLELPLVRERPRMADVVVPHTHCKTDRKAGDKSGDFARNFGNSWLGCLG